MLAYDGYAMCIYLLKTPSWQNAQPIFRCVNTATISIVLRVELHIRLYDTLRWRHNDSDGVSNHQPHDCLLNRLFGRISKKTSKLCVTGLCVGNSPGPVNSPHKGPVTQKMFPLDDVIMMSLSIQPLHAHLKQLSRGNLQCAHNAYFSRGLVVP